MTKENNNQRSADRFVKAALLSVNCIALGLLAGPGKLHAQSSGGASQLPPVQVSPPEEQKRRATTTNGNQRANRSTQRRTQAARRPQTEPADASKAFGQSQEARTGTSGVYSNSTSTATKTNTPLVNIPQSVSVVTKEFIRDQNFQSLTEVTRYVPGVAIHQGEGNRDELVIRGVNSSANFFVNGFRDDVQYFRDLYNTQSIEVLKGPSALIFGRGAGGGLVNRTLKEADGTRIYEATGQLGSWNDQRVTLDAGQAVNENVAVRFNAMYENSDTFRQYGHLERYGINPTVTLKPADDTKIKLSYEYYHDFRLADRGNPSQGICSERARRDAVQSDRAVRAQRRSRRFFGSPIYNYAKVDVQTGMAIIEHDFGNGLTVRNGTIYADYNRGYRNVYPGGTGARVNPGAVNARPDAGRAQRLPERHDRAKTPSTRPTSSGRRRPGRCCTPSPSAPSSAGRPVSRCATAACSRRTPARPPSSSIPSTRPISGRLRSFTIPCATRRNSKYRLNVAVRLCPGPDRDHPLAAAAGRRALRPAST